VYTGHNGDSRIHTHVTVLTLMYRAIQDSTQDSFSRGLSDQILEMEIGFPFEDMLDGVSN
jgi:hypothetical protein